MGTCITRAAPCRSSSRTIRGGTPSTRRSAAHGLPAEYFLGGTASALAASTASTAGTAPPAIAAGADLAGAPSPSAAALSPGATGTAFSTQASQSARAEVERVVRGHLHVR